MSELIISSPQDLTAEAFTDPDQYNGILSKIKKVVQDHEPDLGTKKGRDEIASLAFKVSKTKSAIDKRGKELTEGWREKTKKVNDARKVLNTELDALRNTARQPLTDWENAEASRKEAHEKVIKQIHYLGAPAALESAASISDRIKVLEQFSTDGLEEYKDQADLAHKMSHDALTKALTTALAREAEAAELEALRKEKAERDAQEAREAEQRRIEALKAEQERQQVERERLAAERAKAEAEAKAAREIEAAKQRAEQAERDAQAKIAAEKLRIEQEKQRQLFEQKRLDDERKAKEQDLEHRRAVDDEIVRIMHEGAGIPKAKAQSLLALIISNAIPNITLTY